AQNSDRPVLIACRTVIGYGMPTRAGTQKAHSDAPGAEEVAGAKKALDLPADAFTLAAGGLDDWRALGKRGAAARADWNTRKAASAKAKDFDAAMSGDLPDGFGAAMATHKQKVFDEKATVATRKASEGVLDVVNGIVPTTVG